MSRMEKVNEQIKRVISLIIQEDLSDPRLQFVSITRVDVGKDLRNATVYFSALGDQKQAGTAEQSLNKAKHIIRRELGSKIKMRFTPQLSFKYDQSIRFGMDLEETIKEIHDEHS